MENLSELIYTSRSDYDSRSLNRSDVKKDPFEQFGVWLAEAIENKISEPNAMVLATASADRKPSARIVLLRNFNESGFVFFTNYGSRKARDIEANSSASLLFFWPELERQVRLEGTVSRTSEQVSDEYFAGRPRDSQIGAWVSPQSAIIETREFLEQKFATLADERKDQPIERPPTWGGYVLLPETFEFWQGGKGRLHDRLTYSRTENGWQIDRLAP